MLVPKEIMSKGKERIREKKEIGLKTKDAANAAMKEEVILDFSSANAELD